MLGLSLPARAPPAGAQRVLEVPRQHVPFRVSLPAAAPSCATRPAQPICEDATASCSRSPIACEAAATAQLATYAFPPQAPPVFHWFESCVEEIVKNLDKAPFLQLVFPDRKASFERHQVNASIIAVPQLWRSIADYLSASQPDILVLVHPLDDAETEKCVLHHESKTRGFQQDVMTGIASHPARTSNLQQRLSKCAGQLPAPRSTDVLQGKVGECCDDHEDEAHDGQGRSFPDRASNGVSFFQTGNAAVDNQRGHLSSPTGAYPELTEQLSSDWGLVVQSRYHSGAEGCYVLRTTRNSNPTSDCQCTHYSLTRVCQGEALGTQLGAAWLVN
ncbi:hypothetical protein WJX74_003047 [Apatococcus lobatus]|uniref:DUF7804 domain-containing protein n=1 Tax=Apatococcus lobatus TaxID=904363 RepID=A0AAW1RYE3_9CHLO